MFDAPLVFFVLIICIPYVRKLFKNVTCWVLKEPPEELLELFTEEQLFQLASHYDIEITSTEKPLKVKTVKEVLVDTGVRTAKPALPLSAPTPLSEVAIELRFTEMALQEKLFGDK